MPYCISCGVVEVKESNTICEKCASLAVTPPHKVEPAAQRIVVVGIRLPWEDVFDTLLKIAFAAIPVGLILGMIAAILWVFLR